MAKAVYLGDGNSHKVTKMYEGNGTAQKIKKGYIGDASGKARLFFSSEEYKWNRYTIVTTYKWNQYTVTHRIENGTVNDSGRSGSMHYSYTYDPVYHRRLPRWDSDRNRWDASMTVDPTSWGAIDTGDYIQLSRFDWNGNNTIYQVDHVEYNWSGGEIEDVTFYYSSIIYCTVTERYVPDRLIGEVTSTSSGAYPSNGVSGSYYYRSTGSVQSQGSFIDTVISDNPSQYPNNGVYGGYWYVKVSK